MMRLLCGYWLQSQRVRYYVHYVLLLSPGSFMYYSPYYYCRVYGPCGFYLGNVKNP